jgi:pilus assembly protein CpaE
MAREITTIVQASDWHLPKLAAEAGLSVDDTVRLADLDAVDRHGTPGLLLLDVRGETALPPALAAVRRRHPRMGVIIVASGLEPTMMLEAMRAGVNEFVTEPLSAADLRAAVERVAAHQLAPTGPGKVLAFVGAKGGVGTTTLAVNVAAALAARRAGAVLLVDLHIATHGDTAVLLGLEPRFSVTDALENTSRLDASYLRSLVAHSKPGLDVLASPERPLLRPPEPARVRDMLGRLAEQYALVVLDVPRIDYAVVDALEPLSSVTLVVNQELPTVRRAARLAALLRQRYGGERAGAVVTRYDPRAEIGHDDIEKVVGLPVWATMPSDYRRVVAAANAGKSLLADNHSRLGSAISQLAQRLAGMEERVARSKVGGGLGRFGGLF